jgi:Flp pilus assembly protein TadD
LYYYAGRMDEAAARLQATLEFEPNFWVAHLFLGKVLIEKAQYADAVVELSKAREFSHGNSEAISMIGYAAALAGDTEKAEASTEELTRLFAGRYLPQDTVAAVYTALHRKDEAFAALERAIEQRDVRVSFLRVDPKWSTLRSDLRFAALLQRTGLQY